MTGLEYEIVLERYERELAKFEAKHPHHCRRCGGAGMIIVHENLGPTGGSYGAKACPVCIGSGFCPLCGAELVSDEDTDAGKCTTCGWTEGMSSVTVSFPPAPEPPL